MFKKFSRDSVATYTQARSSESKKIRRGIEEAFPDHEDYIREAYPRKTAIYVAKVGNFSFYADENGFMHFGFHRKEEYYFPLLRTLHMFPDMLSHVRVDRGAIKHVLRGANIMCPGLTSEGADLPEELDEGEPVAIMAEGKQHAVGVGFTLMSTKDMVEINEGIAIDLILYLNDGLWKLPRIEN